MRPFLIFTTIAGLGALTVLSLVAGLLVEPMWLLVAAGAGVGACGVAEAEFGQ